MDVVLGVCLACTFFRKASYRKDLIQVSCLFLAIGISEVMAAQSVDRSSIYYLLLGKLNFLIFHMVGNS